MNNFILFLQKTLGQKIVIGITGLGLCFFVLIHMLGNLLIFSGPDAYNGYAHQLHELVIMEVLEIGIFTLFIGHILTAIIVNVRNQMAKGEQYKKQATGEKKTFFADRLLVFQGAVLLIFFVCHLLTFKFGPHTHSELTINGEEAEDVYRSVTTFFQNPFYLLAYLFALLVLTFHLIHGLSASFRTFGFYHPSYAPLIEKFSWLFGIGIATGFALPILYAYFYL